MLHIEYVTFDTIDPADFLPILNHQKIRTHLVDHPTFSVDTVAAWMESKRIVDQTRGCKVRAVLADGELAGWCGIQHENGQYEIAIVLGESYWGIGKAVFGELLAWARELGHETINIHFLSSRPEYRFLRRVSRKVYESEMFGAKFTTYEIAVNGAQ